MAKKNSPYQIQTWIDEGLSREEAEIKIKELKAKTGESTKLSILVRELAGIQENEDNKN